MLNDYCWFFSLFLFLLLSPLLNTMLFFGRIKIHIVACANARHHIQKITLNFQIWMYRVLSLFMSFYCIVVVIFFIWLLFLHKIRFYVITGHFIGRTMHTTTKSSSRRWFYRLTKTMNSFYFVHMLLQLHQVFEIIIYGCFYSIIDQFNKKCFSLCLCASFATLKN